MNFKYFLIIAGVAMAAGSAYGDNGSSRIATVAFGSPGQSTVTKASAAKPASQATDDDEDDEDTMPSCSSGKSTSSVAAIKSALTSVIGYKHAFSKGWELQTQVLAFPPVTCSAALRTRSDGRPEFAIVQCPQSFQPKVIAACQNGRSIRFTEVTSAATGLITTPRNQKFAEFSKGQNGTFVVSGTFESLTTPRTVVDAQATR